MYLSLETCLSDSENCNILWPKQLAAFKCRLKALESTCQARFLKKRCTLRLFLFWFFPSVYETNELDDQFTILFLCSIPTEETKKRRRRSSIRGEMRVAVPQFGAETKCTDEASAPWSIAEASLKRMHYLSPLPPFDCKTTFIWKMVSVFKWLSRLCLVCPVWGAA